MDDDRGPPMPPLRLGELTTDACASLLRERHPVVLLPVGSTEPHGPHLPLATDAILSERTCELAAEQLRARDVAAVVAPTLPYGVTRYASEFAGAVSLSPETTARVLEELLGAWVAAGFARVCVVNNHLEPEHDAAVRAILPSFDPGRVSIACPLTRRHARTLSDEFKSGACHAGRYETSLVLAAAPHLVRDAARGDLPDVPISLSDGIRRGEKTFFEMGMTSAYAGSPASATAAHGEEQLDLLAAMIEAEVREGLAKL